ncbi:MAG: hypothetical protein QOD26_2776 [Betaproteobacteria bacterium]|jgi:flavin reductase (DIM6/NTAB) family NADH-FMN oxidoreductase RutF|nr:hypothetical protein [Betaproteobacteria bacterium]
MTSLHQRFRDTMRWFVNSVTVVATAHESRRAGFTSTAISCVAFDIPTLLVSVNRTASSHEPILRSRSFSVNLLFAHQEAIAERFTGFKGHKGEARFEGAQWTTLETGAPVLVGALAAFDCRVLDTKDFGSHTLFFGEAVGMASGERTQDAPLVYFDRGYSALNARSSAP